MRPAIGDDVHLTTQIGEHRAAKVTAVEQTPTAEERVGLVVWSTHDTYFCAEVRHNEGLAPNTWHWPEREP